MFYQAGYNATSFTLDMSKWNTSYVKNMSAMFAGAGKNATAFSLNLSGWKTKNVTNMSSMFGDALGYAGGSATTWLVTIPATNGGGISNTTSRFYGKTTSTYGTPPSGKSFTIAA